MKTLRTSLLSYLYRFIKGGKLNCQTQENSILLEISTWNILQVFESKDYISSSSMKCVINSRNQKETKKLKIGCFVVKVYCVYFRFWNISLLHSLHFGSVHQLQIYKLEGSLFASDNLIHFEFRSFQGVSKMRSSLTYLHHIKNSSNIYLINNSHNKLMMNAFHVN